MKNQGLSLWILVLSVASTMLFLKLGLATGFDPTNVITFVNVTNAGPLITVITIDEGTDINLSQGTTYRVSCNVSVTEYNGISDVANVNASFWRLNATENGTLNNETNYFNSSCVTNGSIDSNNHWFDCSFDVYFYAYNGTWGCSATVIDASNFSDYGNNSSEIVALYAINVTDTINYGDMAVGDTSAMEEVNITNFGNQVINVSVYGYGGDNETTGANLSFVCPFNDNISIGYERWSINNTGTWSIMTNLSWNATTIPDLQITKQKDPGTWIINQTYWALQVPPNPYGYCNGTVVFEALAP